MTPAGALTTLVSFNETNGGIPRAGLTAGSDGNLYGTTLSGGANGIGTVFRMTPAGVLTTLVSFNSSNGRSPSGRLTEGNDGNFYGTMSEALTVADGKVFRVTPTGELTTLVSFNETNGRTPSGGLTLGSDGNLYGTTYEGGATGYPGRGTVFQVTPAGALTTLVSFSTQDNLRSPSAGLTLGNDGNFYGTTADGGTSGNGTVFRVTPDGTLTTLVSFSGTNGSGPRASLILSGDGNFYGTTSGGGESGNGTVFRVAPDGTLTTLVSFNGSSGRNPEASLILGKDGNFYGTASGGGTSDYGTVFRVTPAGVLTTLLFFNGTNGRNPRAGLTLGSDGNFYGTTSGGTSGGGTIFKLTPERILTTLVSFNGSTGSYPTAGLTLGSDGNFYGTTFRGGASDYGTVFKMTPTGVLTRLVSFNGTNGGYPAAGLTPGSDRNFYGTTSGIGAGKYGTVFKVTPAGTLTTLHSFDGAHATFPEGTPIFGPDGNLYGTANQMAIWRVNLALPNLPPDTTITSTQPTPTNSTSATITFTGSDDGTPPGSLTFEGRLDATPFIRVNSPVMLEGLAGGTHTYEVRARDAVGSVDDSPASVSWTVVDTTAPETAIISGPSSVVSSTGAEFDFSASETSTFTHMLDGGVPATGPGPVILTGLSEGSHTFSVFATDAAGNTDPTPATRTWSVRPGVNWEAIFSDNRGSTPLAALTTGSDGNFYGTTSEGGLSGYGTVFRVTPAGAITTLVSFDGINGRYPKAGLTLGSDGNFYGTTSGGGASGGGTVFKMTPGGMLTSLASFRSGNGYGRIPLAGLTLGNDGNFYGTTSDGASGYGAIFRVTPGGALTTLVSFRSTNGDGRVPMAGLTLGDDGNFYGTTYWGGASGNGTVFKVTLDGTLTTLVSFDGANGRNPLAGLTLGTDGNFYGTTPSGGASGYGTAFRLTPAGVLTTLVSFDDAVGRSPEASLTLGSDGNLYGTTGDGPSSLAGTVFKLTPDGILTTLVYFEVLNGSHPGAGLTLGGDGNFYGTTSKGGASGYSYGTVFKVTPGGKFTTLASFPNSNGSNPRAGLTLGGDGNFYGTTASGGVTSDGTVFKVTPGGMLTTLHSFKYPDAKYPRATLTQGSDGSFYGTTYGINNGANHLGGTVFRLTPAGALTKLADISGINGLKPQGRLALDSDGNIYGANEEGANDNAGTILKMTPGGQMVTRVSFIFNPPSLVHHPKSGLTLGSDGNFYGVSSGGASQSGAVFKMTPGGTVTLLASFNQNIGSGPNDDLTLASDGNFYGTTLGGFGSIFKVTPGGTLTKLASFNGINGRYPYGGMTLGSDGNFYGTTSEGGAGGVGTVFKVTPAGQLTTLHSFDSAYAANPQGAPVFGPDGNLYGTADKMVIWRLNLANFTPVQNWRMENFRTADNAGAAANDADPDKDGLINVLELAFGTNPNEAISGPGALDYIGTLAGGGTIGQRGQPIVRFESPGAETPHVLFIRRNDHMAAGLAYTAEFSSDLFSWVPNTATPTVLASDTLCEIVSVPYPSAVESQPVRFFRVRVTLTP